MPNWGRRIDLAKNPRDVVGLMHCIIPEGEKGIAKVTHFRVTREVNLENLRLIRDGQCGVKSGTYARLVVDGELMMTDTTNEFVTNRSIIFGSEGDVLIAGLGLGMVLMVLAKRKEVTSVTVVEKHQDVIDLIEPHLRAEMTTKESKRLTILQGDIFEWRPPKEARYDFIYFDIWPDIGPENLPAMTKLHRSFWRWKRSRHSTMTSWEHQRTIAMRQEERVEEELYARFRGY